MKIQNTSSGFKDINWNDWICHKKHKRYMFTFTLPWKYWWSETFFFSILKMVLIYCHEIYVNCAKFGCIVVGKFIDTYHGLALPPQIKLFGVMIVVCQEQVEYFYQNLCRNINIETYLHSWQARIESSHLMVHVPHLLQYCSFVWLDDCQYFPF